MVLFDLVIIVHHMKMKCLNPYCSGWCFLIVAIKFMDMYLKTS